MVRFKTLHAVPDRRCGAKAPGMRASTGELGRSGKGMRLTSQLHDLPPVTTAAPGRVKTRNSRPQGWRWTTQGADPRAPLPHAEGETRSIPRRSFAREGELLFETDRRTGSQSLTNRAG